MHDCRRICIHAHTDMLHPISVVNDTTVPDHPFEHHLLVSLPFSFDLLIILSSASPSSRTAMARILGLQPCADLGADDGYTSR